MPPAAGMAMIRDHQLWHAGAERQMLAPSATCRTGSADPTATASNAGRTAHPRCRSAGGSRGRGRVRSNGAEPSSTASSQTRLMSSSTKRDAVGWRGSKRSIGGEIDEAERQPAARRRQAVPAATGPARSRRRSRCHASAQAARHAGPAVPDSRVVKPAMPVLPSTQRLDVGCGQAHLERRQVAAGRSGTCARVSRLRPAAGPPAGG